MSNKTIKNLLTMAVLATATTGAWGAAAPDKTTKPFPFLDLPRELQHKVLGMAVYEDSKIFDQVARTSRAFRGICNDKLFKIEFLKSLIKYDNCTQLSEFLTEPSQEKLQQEFKFQGKIFSFRLQEIIEALEELTLTQISAGLPSCVGLKKLDLSHSDFSSPQALASLEKLQKLPKLEVLDLSRCHLAQIPEALNACKKLRSLFLYENMMGASSEGLASFGILKNLGNLEKLALSYCSLTRFPAELIGCTQLKVVELDHGDFSSIEALRSLNLALGRFPHLEELSLDNCQLTQIPEALSQCTKLKRVGFSYNDFGSTEALTSLNVVLDRLQQLEQVYLEDCKLTQIPEALKGCTALMILELCHNNFGSSEAFRTLNLVLGGLQQLEELCLEDCHLTQMPNTLKGCCNLQVVDLSNNNFGDDAYVDLMELIINHLPSLQVLRFKELPALLIDQLHLARPDLQINP